MADRTPEKLKNQFDSLRARFGMYHNNVEENRRYYEREFAADVVPAKWRGKMTPVIPQTARRSIDEPSDHILTFPRIRVPVRPTENDSVDEQRIAEHKRAAINAWWDKVSRTFNVIGDGRKLLLNEGKIAIRKTLRWDIIADFPNRSDFKTKKGYTNAVKRYRDQINGLGKSEFPWEVELLDNVTVFEDPSNHRDPRYVFVRYRVFREHADELWPEAKGEWREGNPYDLVEYMEYWSKPGPISADRDWEPGQFVQWIEGEVVHSADNPYPYLPITIEDSGYGVNHMLAKPEDKFVGLTQHAKEMFRAEAENMTSWHVINQLSAFPIGKGRNLPDDKEFEIGPGEIINFEGTEGDPDAEDLTWLGHPDVPQGVIALTEKIDREANATFKTNVLSGLPQRGVDTATEADMNVQNAVAKLSGPIAALQRLIVRITKQVLMDIELVLRAPVTLYGSHGMSSTPGEITLKPTDINGFYEVYAELRTSEQDAIQQSKARFWLEAARVSPALSHLSALERGEVADDPQAEMIRRAGEDVFLGEQMRIAREHAAAQSMGLALAPDEGTEAPAGPSSADSLLGERASQDMNPSLYAPVVSNAMENRDATLSGAQFRN